MRISQITHNVAFGYDKRLNKKLNERLTLVPSTPVTRLIADINSTCNSTESAIVQLEKPENGGVDRNEEQINILLNYFMTAKRTLCHLVDRLFPELNFTKKTIDAYDKEEVERAVLYDYIPQEEAKKPAYKWRENMFQLLENDLENKFLSTPDGLSGVGVGFGEDGAQNSLLKFEPSSSSPKSLNDVVGLDECIEDIKDFILYPLKYPKEAKQREEDYGIKIPSFSVFYGPPG